MDKDGKYDNLQAAQLMDGIEGIANSALAESRTLDEARYALALIVKVCKSKAPVWSEMDEARYKLPKPTFVAEVHQADVSDSLGFKGR